MERAQSSLGGFTGTKKSEPTETLLRNAIILSLNLRCHEDDQQLNFLMEETRIHYKTSHQ